MKYLFKYVTKGPDFSKVLFQKINGRSGTGNTSGTEPVDEVAEYVQCRYICEQDAFWRIFGFSIHTKFPAVERLPVHLPDMNIVRFRAGADLTKIIDSDFLRKTALTEWFVANQRFVHARTLTYCEFPTEWTWDSDSRSWHQRGGTREVVGRVYYVNPALAEVYYLRTLLMIVKGAKSFQDLRTYEFRVYDSFKEACAARGLLGDDNEWYTAFDEAVVWGFGRRLRQLFVTMLIHCHIKDERNFFERYWLTLSDDIQHDLRCTLRNPKYIVSADRLRDMLLIELAEVFIKNGSSIDKFNLPPKTTCDGASFNNRLIHDEMSYNSAELAQQFVLLFDKLNADQTIAYNEIMKSVLEQEPGFFFVSGFGGTGKTYLWNAIVGIGRAHV